MVSSSDIILPVAGAVRVADDLTGVTPTLTTGATGAHLNR